MTAAERNIMQAVLRYNAIPDDQHAEHISMSQEAGRGNLDRHAFRSYRIIWNSWTESQRILWHG